MSVGERSARKSSITNIAAAAVAPIIGMVNTSTTNPCTTTNTSSSNGKRSTEVSGGKHPILQLILNKSKEVQQQQMGVSPTSPTVSHKGASVTITPSYSNALDGDPGRTNSTLVNNNYITSSNTNTSAASLTRSHGLSATQLTGVKNWWKSQMECVSSDEEW